MLTQTAAGRAYDYSHSVGIPGISGPSFQNPVGLAIGEGDVVYVLCRGIEGILGGRPLVPNGYAARVSKVTIGTVPGDEEFVDEFGSYGEGEGQFIWPTGIALDSQMNFYVTDEWLDRVSVFDGDGKFLRQWGAAGSGDGEFNRPSGIAIDPEDNVYIVDSLANRVQKLTKDGKPLAKWGSLGSGPGQFNSPWGICVDGRGDVYVADHKNNRVQKFSPDGEFQVQYGGTQGNGPGQLNRPSGVTVDTDGDVYVCDWANNRVQVFEPDGAPITSFIGDAQELSLWMKWMVDANPDAQKARRRVKSLEPSWRFAFPTGAVFDPAKSRLLVTDTERGRLQIYSKVKEYSEAQFNL